MRRPFDDPAYVVIDLEFESTERAEAFLGFLRAEVWSNPERSPALHGTPEAKILVEEDV